MSVDISVECQCCGAVLYDRGVTYNLAPIYFRVLRAGGIRRGFRGLHQRRLGDVAPQIGVSLAFLHKYWTRLDALWTMDPKYNGWGSTENVAEVLGALLHWAEVQPNAIIEVC